MDMHALFYPKSIGIIGASTQLRSVGNDICRNIVNQGYAGEIYPINPKTDELYGKKCYPSITAVGKQIDMIVVAVPAAVVPSVLEEAGKAGVKAAVIISAGFKEVGRSGELLEAQVIVIANKYNIALIGPNCLGVINAEINMNASFATIMPEAGNIAFVSQSGALCTSVLDYAKGLGIGFSKFLSIGNKACIDEVELIKYLACDDKTSVIIMYSEQLTQASSFIQEVRTMTSGKKPKPIIILKAGRTTAGANASASHTGALGSNDVFIDSIFKKAGVTRANTIEELFDYAISFSNNPVIAGDRIAVLTNAGGPGVLTADELSNSGLQLAVLTEATKDALKAILPASSNIHNPVDVLGDAKAVRYASAMELIVKDPGVDGVVVILTPQTMTEVDKTAEAIVEIKKQTNKPIVTSFMGSTMVNSGVKILQKSGVATVSFPEYAAKSMGAMTTFATAIKSAQESSPHISSRDKSLVQTKLQDAQTSGKLYLPESESREILQAYGFPLLKTQIVHSANEAELVSKEFQGLVAMKIVSPDIIHKSDVGGVKLHILPNNLASTYEEMMATVKGKVQTARLDGVLLMEMAPTGGIELIIGASKDSVLGLSMLMVGMGGIFVEVFKDVAFTPIPVSNKDILEMIYSLNISKILKGTRGMSAYDINALSDCLGRLSILMVDFPQIKELDINPLMLYPEGQGALVLDSRIAL